MNQQRNLYVGLFIACIVVIAGVGVFRAFRQINVAIPKATATATIYLTPTPSPHPPLTALATAGTQIVDANGQPVYLRGVNYSLLEYTCPSTQPAPAPTANPNATGTQTPLPTPDPLDAFIAYHHLGVTDMAIMQSWHINVMRLLLSSSYWNSCPTYKDLVAKVVANAQFSGMYVLLTLQWNAPFANQADDLKSGGRQYPLPDTKQDVAFWREIATTYKANPNVLFDLLSEPHDVTFDEWANGGPITVRKSTTVFPDYPITGTYQAEGMPALAKLVRALAPNLIFLSGIDYGYDLSGLLEGYAVKDVANIVYSTHPFDFPPDKQPAAWQRDFGNAAAKYPVVAAEFGPEPGSGCDLQYAQKALTFFDTAKIPWIAWVWNTTDTCDALLADVKGTPSQYGALIQQDLNTLYAQNP